VERPQTIRPGVFSIEAMADRLRGAFDYHNEALLAYNVPIDAVFLGDSITQMWELDVFFEGTGDRDHHIPWLERATPRDDRDPRENGLGISAGRQGGERIHPAKGEEDDCEVNRSPVPGRESGHTH